MIVPLLVAACVDSRAPVAAPSDTSADWTTGGSQYCAALLAGSPDYIADEGYISAEVTPASGSLVFVVCRAYSDNQLYLVKQSVLEARTGKYWTIGRVEASMSALWGGLPDVRLQTDDVLRVAGPNVAFGDFDHVEGNMVAYFVARDEGEKVKPPQCGFMRSFTPQSPSSAVFLVSGTSERAGTDGSPMSVTSDLVEEWPKVTAVEHWTGREGVATFINSVEFDRGTSEFRYPCSSMPPDAKK